MSRFSRLTGHGVAGAIKPEYIDEAKLLGLPTDEKELAAVYKGIAGIVDGYSPTDPRNFALYSKVGDDRIKPTSVSGADGALAVVGTLMGLRDPNSIVVAKNTLANGDGKISLCRVNEPFIIRPEIDEPYLRGFITVLNLAAIGLAGKLGLTKATLDDLQTSARETSPQLLAASHNTNRALLYCGLKGMTNEFPDLGRIAHEFPEDFYRDPILAMVVADQNEDGYFISIDAGNGALADITI